MRRFLLLALAIFLISLALFFIFKSLVVKKIILPQNSCISQDEFLAKTQVLGKNMLLLKVVSLKKVVEENYNCAKEITITKQLPNTLEIKIINLDAVLQLEGTNLYLTKDGQILPKSDTKKPVLFLSKNFELPNDKKITDTQILYAAKIADQIARSDFDAATLRLLGTGDVAVYNSRNAIAIFSVSKDLNLQIDSLQRVLAESKIDATKIEKIDLRFDKPVVTFK